MNELFIDIYKGKRKNFISGSYLYNSFGIFCMSYFAKLSLKTILGKLPVNARTLSLRFFNQKHTKTYKLCTSICTISQVRNQICHLIIPYVIRDLMIFGGILLCPYIIKVGFWLVFCT